MFGALLTRFQFVLDIRKIVVNERSVFVSQTLKLQLDGLQLFVSHMIELH